MYCNLMHFISKGVSFKNLYNNIITIITIIKVVDSCYVLVW